MENKTLKGLQAENNKQALVKTVSNEFKGRLLPSGKRKSSIDKDAEDELKNKERSPTKETIDILGELGPQRVFMDEITKTINFDIIRELLVIPHRYSTSPTRIIKMTSDLHRPFVIMEDGTDLTPKRAIDCNDPRWVAEPKLFNFPSNTYTEIKPNDFLITGKKQTDMKKYVFDLKQELNLKIENSTSESDSDDEASKAPSMFPLKYPEPKVIDKMKTSFTLKETDTTMLLDLPSMISQIDCEEGHLVTKTNTLYSTICKRLRKKMDNYCQTSTRDTKKVKETQLSRPKRFNQYSFSSRWDQFDSLIEAEKLKNKNITTNETHNVVGKVTKIKYAEEKSGSGPIVGDNFKIVDSSKWFKMGMVMERVLLSNNAMERQLVFHDHLKSNPLSISVEFKYNLNRLWTLRTDKTSGMPVTCMSWNFFDANILAVGYGKFHFTDKNEGVVCIWNNKNLAHPERQYTFPHAVTSLSFCKTYPDILAISFYSGWVILIDILKKDNAKIVARNMSLNKTFVSPVWAVTWKQTASIESVVECRADGFVFEYTRKHLYEKRQIMKVAKMKGTVKGITHQKKCQPYVIPLVRNPAILCIAFNPVDYTIYYIGTDEGGVYKCSIKDVHQHMEMFLAHNGPVYTIQFHPACSKVFLTCGADWYIRIWGDNIHSPLITMMSGISAIQSACWCPTLPTIILAITDTKVELWDISRRVVYPQAVFENPKGALNTALTFSKFGNNLCVGDSNGDVHVYSLTNMPFQPSNSDMVLALILIKALTPRRKVLNELLKLGYPFNVSRIYKNYLNL